MSPIDLKNRTVVVTGVGFRTSSHADSKANVFTSDEIKPNIGASVALAAAQAGYSVVTNSKSEAKLQRVCDSIRKLAPNVRVQPSVADLLSEREVKKLVESIPIEFECDLVHCAGLSAGSYTLPNDNPYLAIDETPAELAVIEFEAVVKSLLILVRAFLPRWKRQTSTRLVVVSSMSGIRAVPLGYSHASAKGGLRQAVRSLTLELNPLGIRVCEVQPGMVNTGLYDPPAVDAAIRKMGRSFGYEYEPGKLPQMQPKAVADAVVLCLTSDAHILAVSMVSSGQFPNLGA